MADQPADHPADQDPAKDRFREALERKRKQQHTHNSGVHDESKIHASHERAGGKREFRRKSG